LTYHKVFEGLGLQGVFVGSSFQGRETMDIVMQPEMGQKFGISAF
jgi:hypothetical protein